MGPCFSSVPHIVLWRNIKKKKIKGVPEVFGKLLGETKELALRSECWGFARELWADSPTTGFCWGFALTSDHSPSLLPASLPASGSQELGWSQLRMGIWEI